MIIGIDFGGVLSVHDAEGAEHRNTAINIPGGVEALEKLKDAGHDLYLISFCGKSRAVETSNSIESNGCSKFFTEQYYVKKKEYKNDICLKLGCHFMVDDRVEILDHIRKYNPTIKTILFGDANGNNELETDHQKASNWDQVIEIINKTESFETEVVEPKNLNKLRYNLEK
jgi:hypothetical protein